MNQEKEFLSIYFQKDRRFASAEGKVGEAMKNSNNQSQDLSTQPSRFPRPALPAWVTTDRTERLEAANELLRVIASCGRKFFAYGDRVSRFEVDGRGRIWFIDKYTQKRIYVQYKGEWKAFSDGGTLRRLIEHLRDFITHGNRIPAHTFGPWPDWVCKGDLWGYGDSMAGVRDVSTRLGITDNATARDAETAQDGV